jgi:hypothetical protein
MLLALAGCGRQEAADWKQATLADSAEAYKLFLQQHPHSAEGAQAQARIELLGEQRDWQIASSADTRDSYQLFLSQHPDSKWAQEARIRIENFAQAGVSGGAALAASANPPPAGTAEEAAANDASAGGVTATSPVVVRATASAATAAAASGAAAAPVLAQVPHTAAAAVTPKVAHRAPLAHAQHAHATLAHAAHNGAHRLARSVKSGAPPVLQLGAFRTRARAESEWRQLTVRFSTLKGLHPRYVTASSHSGRVYRLQVRVSSAAEASGVCASLKRRARSCVRLSA